jgi:methionyl-tRNA synthetase
VGRANKYIEEAQPWTLAKNADPRLGTVCRNLLESIRVGTLLLNPVIPRATAAVAADMGITISGDVTEALRRWDVLASGDPIGVGSILFPRLDRAAVLGAA